MNNTETEKACIYIEAALAEISDPPAALNATAVERIEISLSRAVEILSTNETESR